MEHKLSIESTNKRGLLTRVGCPEIDTNDQFVRPARPSGPRILRPERHFRGLLHDLEDFSPEAGRHLGVEEMGKARSKGP